MDLMTYVKVSLVNLLFLLIGVALGGVYFSSRIPIVYAYQAQQKPSLPTPILPGSDMYYAPGIQPHVELIGPSIQTNAAAFAVLLSNRVAADNVVVSGIDILRLHELTLELLRDKGIADTTTLHDIVVKAQTSTLLRIAPSGNREMKQR
jgi:hypothetical protein